MEGLVRVGGCGVGVSAHCWVLKEHVSVFSGVACMSLFAGVSVGGGVVCVLFENCIVDASILFFVSL